MRKRRKKSEIPFADALEFARKRLVKAKKERESASVQVAILDREIPDLERTIHALDHQLKEPKYVHLSAVGEIPGRYLSISHYNNVVVTEEPANVVTEDDTLPEPEGAELLPE